MNVRFPFRSDEGPKGRRKWLRRLLMDRALEDAARWASERRDVNRALNSLLFDGEELVCWRAIEAIGRLAGVRAAVKVERVREMMRRLLWAMNDESGNSIRHAPQLMGEILANVPELIPEFAHYLLSFRDSSMHDRGTAWAMARVASIAPHTFRNFSSELTCFLRDPDPEVRGLALLSLSPDVGGTAKLLAQSLQNDPAELRYYDTAQGAFQDATVGEMARLRRKDRL
jgi:hypothetical protein